MAVALLATGCSSAVQSTARSGDVKRSISVFTCCDRRDVYRVYHPGDVIDLHWMRESTYGAAPAKPSPITLRAALDDGVASAAAAKAQGANGQGQVIAQPLLVTDETITAPISKLRIPADASPGLYNLAFTIDYGGGTQSGQSIIRISRPTRADG